MKPVLILQHLNADGPAYLRQWLDACGQPFEVRNSELGDAVPARIEGWSALAVLGGEMSANDPLPSLRAAERLILDAMEAGVPVLGHCLGGQLMARALGAAIVHSPAPEIGWHPVAVAANEAARAWFGERDDAVVFQWHYDAFELPPGAQSLARSDACPHQAFAIGPHLAMQFHIEVDEPKLRAWTAAHEGRFFAGAAEPTVQTAEQMLAGIARHLAAQQRLADRVYDRWLQAVR